MHQAKNADREALVLFADGPPLDDRSEATLLRFPEDRVFGVIRNPKGLRRSIEP